MRRSSRFCLLVGSALLLTACNNNQPQPTITQQPPSFLPNYSLLKPIKSPEGTQMYVYKAPGVTRSDYHAIIVEPVKLYQTADKQSVSDQQIQGARASINQGIRSLATRHIQLTNQAGPGVVRLEVAITGASLEKEGFKPWNIIPISAAIKLASMATDTDSKKPMLVIEMKFTDSQSGRLLKEIVTTISGEAFRDTSNTSTAFKNLANAWVDKAMKYAN